MWLDWQGEFLFEFLVFSGKETVSIFITPVLYLAVCHNFLLIYKFIDCCIREFAVFLIVFWIISEDRNFTVQKVVLNVFTHMLLWCFSVYSEMCVCGMEVEVHKGTGFENSLWVTVTKRDPAALLWPLEKCHQLFALFEARRFVCVLP